MKFRYIISLIIAVVMMFTCVASGLSATDDTVCMGDVNLDGRITLTDCSYMLKYIAKWDMSKWNFFEEYADCNGDGRINISDVSFLLRTCLNYWNPDADK